MPVRRPTFVRLDPRSTETLQGQIYAAIRAAILDGTLSAGEAVPSSRELAEDLDVSRTTTLLAFEQLRAEGYLTARRGSGTFVAAELPDDVPRMRIVRASAPVQHPPVSARGAVLAALPPTARRTGPIPRAFRLGVPALDRFPIQLWSQLVTRRLRRATLRQLDYGDATGLPELRAAIADHVSRARGTTCTADQIVVVAGAQRGLELVARMLLDPGDEAFIEDPGYTGARSALLAAGARLVPARVDEQGVDVGVIARHQGRARLAYVTPSHQFPLGVPMTLARRLALLKWASAARAWIVEDDYDSEFRYGARPIPCLHGLDKEGRVIYIGSFSKTLFPALRLGFVVVPGDLQEMVRAVRRVSEHHPPTIDQAALADLMAGGHFERHLRRMRAVYTERAEALVAAAARYTRGALALRPIHTGLHVTADVVDLDAGALADEAVDRGLEVMPVSAYRIDEANSVNALVLGFAAVGPDALTSGMERLAAAIDAVRARRTPLPSPRPAARRR